MRKASGLKPTNAPRRPAKENIVFPAADEGRLYLSFQNVLKLERAQRIPVPPTLGNGKICYIEIPATDIARSADFYSRCFGWKIRTRGDGATAFDDGVGQVSGAFVTGRPPASQPGFMIYIMVDSVAATIEAITVNGGEIVQPIGADAPEITARFRDSGGNVVGLYQEPA